MEDALGAVDALVNDACVLHVGPFLGEHDEWTRRQVDMPSTASSSAPATAGALEVHA